MNSVGPNKFKLDIYPKEESGARQVILWSLPYSEGRTKEYRMYPGDRLTLTFANAKVLVEEEVYGSRPVTLHLEDEGEINRWDVDGEGHTLILGRKKGGTEPLIVKVKGKECMTLLDAD